MHTSRRCVGATTGTEDSQVTHDDAHVQLEQEERHIDSLRKPWRHLYQYACKMIKLIQSKTPLIGAILCAPRAHTHAHAFTMLSSCGRIHELVTHPWLHACQ